MPPKTFPSPRLTWSDGRETSLDPLQIDSAFLGRMMRQGREPFDQYLSSIGAEKNSQDILEALARGTLKGYHVPNDELYDQLAGGGDLHSLTSQGFYRPASAEGDTARFFLRNLHSPTTGFHEIAHDAVGHDLDDPTTPKLSWWDMLDKESGGILPAGAYKTRKGYEKEFGSQGGDVYDAVYSPDHPAHPNLTQAHYDEYIEEPAWNAFPPSLQDSLTAMSTGQMAYPKPPPKNPPKQSFWDYLWN